MERGLLELMDHEEIRVTQERRGDYEEAQDAPDPKVIPDRLDQQVLLVLVIQEIQEIRVQVTFKLEIQDQPDPWGRQEVQVQD
jgi:hypothetical protein